MALQSSNNNLTRRTSIENRNFLSPIGFKFAVSRLAGVTFFCNQVTLPSVGIGSPNQFTALNKIPQPGDELQYGDLTIRFLVDENMKNWYQVHDWIRELAAPKSENEFAYKRGTIGSNNPLPEEREEYNNQWKSDCSLFVLSSNYNSVAEFIFKDAFPINLTSLPFDATQTSVEYLTAEVTLKYAYFDYEVRAAAEDTDATMPQFHLSELGDKFHTNTAAKPFVQFDATTGGGPNTGR